MIACGTQGRFGSRPTTITASARPDRSAVSIKVVPAPPAAAPERTRGLFEVSTKLWRYIPVQRSSLVRVRPKILISERGVAVSLPGQTSRHSEQVSQGMDSGAISGTGRPSSPISKKPGLHTATQAPHRVHMSWSRISRLRSKNDISSPNLRKPAQCCATPFHLWERSWPPNPRSTACPFFAW